MKDNNNQNEKASLLNRVPPNNSDAELFVLSAMLFDREAASIAYEMLKGNDFYRPDHKVIFECMAELFVENTSIDVITLKNKLEERNVFDQIGGMSYLANLAGAVSTSANIKHHVKIVYDKSILRKILTACNEIADASYEGSKNIDALLEFAEKSIFNISSRRNTSNFSHIKDVLMKSINSIERIYKSGSKITGIPTGFADLDIKTAGFQPSDLILIAARPSMGKTAFALNIAQYAASHENIPTAIFSLEMSEEQLANRILCSEAMINSQKLRTGQLEPEDWSKIIRSASPLSLAPLYIDDTPGISVSELRSKCRKLKLEKNLQLVIIDYLQLMSGNGSYNSRQQEISEISRALKSIAREIEAPVIALSQLSRACELRADHRPMLSDLRESGAIEQDADVVAFLYRDEYYNPETEKKNQAEVIIAKQRNGPTGTIDLAWLSEYTKFADLESDFDFI